VISWPSGEEFDFTEALLMKQTDSHQEHGQDFSLFRKMHLRVSAISENMDRIFHFSEKCTFAYQGQRKIELEK
jgi:hypothetical protein